MSGSFTRKMYDGCATQQVTKQSTDPLELILDVNKYVNCNNLCKLPRNPNPSSAQLVDVESSLRGIDKLASRCDSAKHPFCAPNGCLLTNDPRVPPHITPYACERGHAGDRAVITTNMRMPTHPGYNLPDPNICNNNSNGYYSTVPKQQQTRKPNVPNITKRVVHPSTHQVVHPSTHQVVHPATHQVVHPATHQVVHPATHQVVHPSTHQVIHSNKQQVPLNNFNRCIQLKNQQSVTDHPGNIPMPR
ncbi:hypothetical protein QLL95_gp1043 [Cotonvirus japonicus]|uniref:Uncharacterized protein n=1 Tax=Cotonvirus japonicus TaxID=2811091 RepID=A0ABM7NSE4_9VIRU|nr:hypothetical protein QLL95_gp1043 [Cotonvirus japonicus]BCS83080.1 hypothetical protein [Cotonvirus japonicus]